MRRHRRNRSSRLSAEPCLSPGKQPWFLSSSALSLSRPLAVPLSTFPFSTFKSSSYCPVRPFGHCLFLPCREQGILEAVTTAFLPLPGVPVLGSSAVTALRVCSWRDCKLNIHSEVGGGCRAKPLHVCPGGLVSSEGRGKLESPAAFTLRPLVFGPGLPRLCLTIISISPEA